LSNALDQLNLQIGGRGGVSFARGSEFEIGIKVDIENLMSKLSRDGLQVQNKTLLNAMMMPKDKDENAESYPKVRDSLFHNPFGTPAYKKMEA